jgi:hypothetical protein
MAKVDPDVPEPGGDIFVENADFGVFRIQTFG